MSFPLISRTIRIFYSCITTVSKDMGLWRDLHSYVGPWIWEGKGYTVQSNYRDDPESGLREEPDEPVSIENAHLIVLLLSPTYLSSERYEREIKRAIERRKANEVELIPVTLYGEPWKYSPLQEWLFVPQNHRPLFRRSGDVGLREVSHSIIQAVTKLISSHTQPAVTTENSSLDKIPYPPNDFFTDRQEIMQEIQKHLEFAQKKKQTQKLTLHGPPGSGKTQIAVEYAHTYLDKYQEILWVDGNSLASLSDTITSLAIRLQFRIPDRENEQRLFEAMKRWLQENKNWLVVVDDLKELHWLDHFIPGESYGHVLVTTRYHTTGTLTRAIPVPPMTRDDNIAFLLRRAKIIDQQTTLEDAPEDVVAQATEIVQEFDSIVLILDQIGAYVDEQRCELKRYLELYRQMGPSFLDERGHLTLIHKLSVQKTFKLSIQEAGPEKSAARLLLYLLSFFPPYKIPRALISDGILMLKSRLLRELARPQELEKAFGTLLRFSLVQQRSGSPTLSIYRVVQELVKEELMEPKRRRWAYLVVRLIHYAFPEPCDENRSECERYFPLALHCAWLIDRYQLAEKECASFLERLGYYCYQQALYEKAETYLFRALQMYEQRKIHDQNAYAVTLNSVGILFCKQGKYQQAEEAYQQALEIRRQLYGQNDALISQTLNNLGLVYRDVGKYTEAENLYQQALAIDEQTVGPDHLDTATSLHNLATVYEAQGNEAQATRYYQRAYSIEERILDSDDPKRASSLNALAKRYQVQGQYIQAEEFFLRAILLQEKGLGKEHPDLAVTLHNLASLFVKNERYQEAEALYQRSLAIYEKAFGPEHPEIAGLFQSMGYLACQQELYYKAEDCYQQALTISKKIYGSSSMVANLLNDLGQLYCSMQQDELAEAYMRDGLKMREEIFGPEHAECCFSLNTLAAFFRDRHEYEQMAPLYQRILSISQHTTGPAVPDPALVQEEYTFLLECIKAQKKSHYTS